MTRIGTGLSTSAESATAALEAATRASEVLGGEPVDLAFLFLTQDHLPEAGAAAAAVHSKLRPRFFVGCVAQGIVSGGRELESGPGASVFAAALPGAEIETFHTTAIADDDSIGDLPDLEGADMVVLLPDPYTFPADAALRQAAREYPGVPLVGGLAIGGAGPGEQALLEDDQLHADGAVGAVLRGAGVEAIVSQGCAPLGREAVITRGDGNVVLELAGQPALDRLRDTIASLSPREQALASRGILAGLVIDENQPEYSRGDYLMRAILGADDSTGALAIGERVRIGQTLRFHARDADSAREDLTLTLQQGLRSLEPAGALLFTCNGRGKAMFGTPDHDSQAVSGAIGRPAVAGFFCGGEIGPVGDRSFLHGFTATMAVFVERRAQR
jgi:small ligand-binding sensory domain FIST